MTGTEQTTSALMAKSYAASSLSLLLTVTMAFLIPGVEDRKVTLKVSELPGLIFLGRERLLTVKFEAFIPLICIEEISKISVPRFWITKGLMIGVPELVVPKLVKSESDGVISPLTIFTLLPVIFISGAITVTVKVQVAVLPLASVAVAITLLEPIGKKEPETGL